MFMAKIVRQFIKSRGIYHPKVLHYVFKCLSCNDEFEVMASYYRKQIKKQKNACSFCSHSCTAKHVFKKYGGSKHSKWRGGVVIDKNGYKMIHDRKSDMSMSNGYVLEHRRVMAKHIGRSLSSSELVHHINGNKLDNRIENLTILDRGKHSGIHIKEKWRSGKITSPMLGKKHSLLTKEKMSKAKRGRKRESYHWI